MQQPMFTFAVEELSDLAPPLEADQKQRLIELMAQAIEAVLQHARVAEEHDDDHS